MQQQKTHREIKNPQISARYLSDYMAASETAKRTIVRDSKYRPIARLLQHDEAKLILSKFIREGKGDLASLHAAAAQLKQRMADSDYERDLFDHNADYISRFAKIYPSITLPHAECLAPGKVAALELKGVKVTTEIHFRLRRLTKTNKIRVGAGMLRYAKGKTLPPNVGEWQSAFLFGYLGAIGAEDGAEIEHQLCLTWDAYTGTTFQAPTDATRRFQNMSAACETIAERWPNVAPPANAVL